MRDRDHEKITKNNINKGRYVNNLTCYMLLVNVSMQGDH